MISFHNCLSWLGNLVFQQRKMQVQGHTSTTFDFSRGNARRLHNHLKTEVQSALHGIHGEFYSLGQLNQRQDHLILVHVTILVHVLWRRLLPASVFQDPTSPANLRLLQSFTIPIRLILLVHQRSEWYFHCSVSLSTDIASI
jgi:hypothetical protein